MQVLKVSILVILILIMAVFAASFIANIMLNNMVKEEVTALYEHVGQNGEFVQSKDFEDLPMQVFTIQNPSMCFSKSFGEPV